MSVTITDTIVSGSTNTGLPNLLVTTTPAATPVYLKSGGTYYPAEPPWPTATTNGSGVFSLTLYWPSEMDPSTTAWRIILPDGTAWQGVVPEGVAGPLSLKTLKDTYNWGLVTARAAAVQTVTGPAGIAGPAGPAGAAGTNATTTVAGVVLIDQAPGSGSPIAVTTPRLGAASGVAQLGTGGTVPLGQLPLLPNTQVTSGTATSGQVLTATGSGTATWVNGPSGILTTIGDLIVEGAGPLPTRLAAVAAGALFTSAGVGTLPAWQSSPSITGSLTAGTAAINGTVLNASAAPSFAGTLIGGSVNGIVVFSVDGLGNETLYSAPATVGTQTVKSPILTLQSAYWGGGISNNNPWTIQANQLSASALYTQSRLDISYNNQSVNPQFRMDADGNVTLFSFNPLAGSRPTVTAAAGGLTGAYYWVYTEVTLLGESAPSNPPSSALTLTAQGASVSCPTLGTQYPYTAINVYRTKAGGASSGPFYFAVTASSTPGTSPTVVTDNTSDANLGALAPPAGTRPGASLTTGGRVFFTGGPGPSTSLVTIGGGVTPSQNALGTLLMLSAPTNATGDLLNMQVNAVSQAKVDVAGNLTTIGTVSVGKHLLATGTAPTLSNPGTNVTATLVAGSDDVSGIINLVIVTSPPAGGTSLVTFTFATAFGHQPSVIFNALVDATAGNQSPGSEYYSDQTAAPLASFQLKNINNTGLGTFRIAYVVIG